jgi:hypothetical protein
MKTILFSLTLLSFVPAMACKMTALTAQKIAASAIIESLESLSDKKVESVENLEFLSQFKAAVKYTYTDGVPQVETRTYTISIRGNCDVYIQEIE